MDTFASVYTVSLIPENTAHWSCGNLMFVHRLRRWPSIKLAQDQMCRVCRDTVKHVDRHRALIDNLSAVTSSGGVLFHVVGFRRQGIHEYPAGWGV